MAILYYEALGYDIGIAQHPNGKVEVVSYPTLADVMIGRYAPDRVYAGVITWETAKRIWPKLEECEVNNE